MHVSVVLSFKNEQENIKELIKRLDTMFQGINCPYELVFVNDASTDQSLNILEEERTRNKNIKIITMSRCFGVYPCIAAGLKHTSGDAVVYMDADLQDPPELIPQMIERWKKGAKVVHTTRTKRKGENPVKMFITKLAYLTIKTMIRDFHFPLDSGDFKLLDRTVVNELCKLPEKEPFIKGLIPWIGYTQDYVLYERDQRYAGKTHFPLIGSLGPIKAFISGIIPFSDAPLLFSFSLGLSLILLSLGYIAIYTFFSLQISILLFFILFMSGMQLFSIGIFGFYIGRIYKEVKNRPDYIIEKTTGL